MLIRDPVHGDISLTTAEREILDTPALQRLRGVKQLGAAYLVYPGCVHTRFEHSLGTLAAAQRILST
ncbi:MAG TPA: HD domain-containing protein, partial [Limnochordia bacterium]